MAAAVADYAPIRTEEKKIKRESGNYSIELKPNPDIAAALGQAKAVGSPWSVLLSKRIMKNKMLLGSFGKRTSTLLF